MCAERNFHLTVSEENFSPEPGPPTPQTGNNRAMVLVTCFLLAIFGFIVYFNTLAIPFHGADLDAFVEHNDLHHVVTWPAAQEYLPHAPLTLLSLAANYVPGNGSPAVLHAGNLLLHILNALLLYLVVRAVLRKRCHELTAALSGFLLLVHPAVTQSVNYLVDRPALLGAFFGLLALLAWLRATDDSSTPRFGWLALAFACYLAAVASCTLLLPLPLLALLIRPLATRQPVAAGGALFAFLLATAALWAAGGLPSHQIMLPTFFEAAWSPATFQPAILLPVGSPPHWAAWWAYLLVATLGAVLSVALAKTPVAIARTGAGVVAGIAVLVLAVLSYQQTSLWRDPQALWATFEDDAPAQVELAKFLLHEADTAQNREAAANVLDRAVRMDPDLEIAHSLLGDTLLQLGQIDEARKEISSALRLNPFNGKALWNLGLIDAAKAQQTGNRAAFESARTHLARAAELRELTPDENLQYAAILGQTGRFAQALEQLPRDASSPEKDAMAQQYQQLATRQEQLRKNALQNPGDINAAVGQAEAALLSGKVQSAYYMLDRFLRQDPTNENAWKLLAIVQGQSGNAEQFVSEWGDAAPATPDNWKAVAARAGVPESESLYLAKALGTDPGALETQLAMAESALTAGNIPRAVALLQQAAKDHPESPAPWDALARIAESQNDNATAERLRDQANVRKSAPDQPAPPIVESVPATPQLPQRTIIR